MALSIGQPGRDMVGDQVINSERSDRRERRPEPQLVRHHADPRRVRVIVSAPNKGLLGLLDLRQWQGGAETPIGALTFHAVQQEFAVDEATGEVFVLLADRSLPGPLQLVA